MYHDAFTLVTCASGDIPMQPKRHFTHLLACRCGLAMFQWCASMTQTWPGATGRSPQPVLAKRDCSTVPITIVGHVVCSKEHDMLSTALVLQWTRHSGPPRPLSTLVDARACRKVCFKFTHRGHMMDLTSCSTGEAREMDHSHALAAK